MSMLQEINADSDLLRVRATGEFSLDEAKRNFLEMMEAVVLHRSKRVLVDGQTVTGNPRTIERFYYGEFTADAVMKHHARTEDGATRFAYVLREPVLDPGRFGETVAANRGMLIKVCDNVEEALKWLATPLANKPDDS
jgi:hypothetical protein